MRWCGFALKVLFVDGWLSWHMFEMIILVDGGVMSCPSPHAPLVYGDTLHLLACVDLLGHLVHGI